MRSAAARWSLLAAALPLGLTLFGCGGGASSYNPPPPPPPPPPALAITTTSPLPEAIVGQAYNFTLQASGGSPPYTWSLPLGSGLLPDGISLSPSGVLSGTPTTFAPGVAGGQFQVQDSRGATASAQLELIAAAPLTFSVNPILPVGNVALPYSLYLSVTGGVQPFNFTLTTGSNPLPPGLTLGSSGNTSGLVEGTPTTPGSYSFSVQVTDSGPTQMHATQSFSLQIQNNLILPNGSLPDAVQNVAYVEYIKPGGGTPPYHFALGQNSSLPPGFSLDQTTGKVSGTPTTVPQFPASFVVMISDSAPTPATISPFVTLNIQPPLAFQTTTLPDFARGLNYNNSVFIVGGRAPYTLQLASGALPDGLTISTSPSFSVSGVPTKDGLFQFMLKVSDSYETPNTSTQNFQVRISDQMVLSGPTQAQILYNQNYSTTFPVTGGFPPYAWRMNAVPSGFTFDPSTGTLNGTPSGASQTTSIVNVHDSSSPPLTANYLVFSLTVYGKLSVSTNALPAIATGRDTSIGIFSTGGAAPLQWSIAPGGVFPPGMTFGTNAYWEIATISGAPTQAGSYAFTLALSDGNAGSLHQTASLPLTLTVKDPGQMTRNDALSTATPLSNIMILASISPYSDPSTAGPDIDVYSASAAPGSVVNVGVTSHSEFAKPQNPPYDSLMPVVEIVDVNGVRYQTCGGQAAPNVIPFNKPCINGLPGSSSGGSLFGTAAGQSFQVPGTGTAPVTFFIRISDARGDARPDFIYTLIVFGVN